MKLELYDFQVISIEHFIFSTLWTESANKKLLIVSFFVVVVFFFFFFFFFFFLFLFVVVYFSDFARKIQPDLGFPSPGYLHYFIVLFKLSSGDKNVKRKSKPFSFVFLYKT